MEDWRDGNCYGFRSLLLTGRMLAKVVICPPMALGPTRLSNFSATTAFSKGARLRGY